MTLSIEQGEILFASISKLNRADILMQSTNQLASWNTFLCALDLQKWSR